MVIAPPNPPVAVCNETSAVEVSALIHVVQVTSYVAMLSRWMAAELYAKEIEVLMFELSMSKCSQELWDRCAQLAKKQSEKAAGVCKAGSGA
jgi:hypothetical protein